MEFKRPLLEDKETLDYYFKQMDDRACELSFANTFLWSKHYGIEYAIMEDMLVFKSIEKDIFGYPIGLADIKPVIEKMTAYYEEKGQPFCMRSVTEKMFEQLEQAYPGKFQITYDRDEADYLYLSEKLITLSGKKYHGKRNHINKFKAQHTDWTYERICDDNIQDCIEMAQQWRVQNECDEDEDKSAEICVTLNYLKYFNELGVVGGLIRLEGRVIAFTIGEPIGSDTFVVHIEKAFSDIQGAYPLINQQFIADYGKDYMYVNREEDLGSEGLRKAKLSYRPIMMVEKGMVTLKE